MSTTATSLASGSAAKRLPLDGATHTAAGRLRERSSRDCTARNVVYGDAVADRDIELLSELDHGAGRLPSISTAFPDRRPSATVYSIVPSALDATKNRVPSVDTPRPDGRKGRTAQGSSLPSSSKHSLPFASPVGRVTATVSLSSHNLCLRPELRRGYRSEIAGTEEGHGLVVHDDDISAEAASAPGVAALGTARCC